MTRLTLLVLALSVQVHAQSRKLIIADPPKPATIEGYERGHCVVLRNRIRLRSERKTRLWSLSGGQWRRYYRGELTPLPRSIVARRYLLRFERERLATLESDRIPYQWLANRNAEQNRTEILWLEPQKGTK